MHDIQVLVATMNQSDFSIGEKMNIGCSAVFANQTDRCEVEVANVNDKTWMMISTNTVGVGLNRNIALLAADADIVLFADDDISYYEASLEGVKEAFQKWPDADVMIFSTDLEKNGQIYKKKRVPHKRMHIWNSLRYGTYAIAAKRESLLRANIMFHQCFGGGCIYGSGEDTLLLVECFKRGLKVYSYNYILGKCNKDSSSWFTGFNEKFFYDKGALLATAFPICKYLTACVFAIRFKKTDLPLLKRFRLMIYGMKNVKQLIPYSQV